MKRSSCCRTSFLLCVVLVLGSATPGALEAQSRVSIPFPFLLLPASASANGMGGAAAVLPSAEATATVSNPAQLGLASLNNTFSFAATVPKVDWEERTAPSSVYLSTRAANLGLNLSTVLSLPFPVSLGVGYAQTTVDWGAVIEPSLNYPGPDYQTIQPHDEAEIYSLAIGVDYYIRLAAGWNYKSVRSGPFDYSTEDETFIYPPVSNKTADWGLLATVPIAELASELRGKPWEVPGGFTPLLDLSVGYVRANIRDDRLVPRAATLGVGLEAGLTTKVAGTDWKAISLSMVREAQDLLISWPPPYGRYPTYRGESINFLENVIGGRPSGQVSVRKGWQIALGECLTLRGGSIAGQVIGGVPYPYETAGYSLSLGGLVHLVEYLRPTLSEVSWLRFIGDHLDLQFHSASYETSVQRDPLYQGSPGLIHLPSGSLTHRPMTFSGTTFTAMNLVVKGIPWQ